MLSYKPIRETRKRNTLTLEMATKNQLKVYRYRYSLLLLTIIGTPYYRYSPLLYILPFIAGTPYYYKYFLLLGVPINIKGTP